MPSLILVSLTDINLKTSHKSVAEPGVFNTRTQSPSLVTDLNRCHLPAILIMCSLVLGQILTLCFLCLRNALYPRNVPTVRPLLLAQYDYCLTHSLPLRWNLFFHATSSCLTTLKIWQQPHSKSL